MGRLHKLVFLTTAMVMTAGAPRINALISYVEENPILGTPLPQRWNAGRM